MKTTSPALLPQAHTQANSPDFDDERKNYIEQHFDVIEWSTPHQAHIVCPGQDLHSTPTKPTDTIVFTDGTPTIHCYHESCKDTVVEANRCLRSAFEQIASSGQYPHRRQYSLSHFHGKPSREDRLVEAAKRSKSVILERYPWSLSDLRESSPYTIPSDPMEQFRLQLGVYSQGKNEAIFHGGLRDSGDPRHRSYFLTEAQWKELPRHLGEFVSQSSYAADCYERKQERLRKRLVFVVECDDINEVVRDKVSRKEELTEEDKLRNKEASCALYRWMKEAVGMRLLWVVDSGNKSLHAAFEVPDKSVLEELKVILPALGADSRMLKDSQLTRAAGARRDGDGSIQELLYCDPINL
ncbi:MAG: hypothetical protein AAF491_05550 [Verrucomicrobiota bacterium]